MAVSPLILLQAIAAIWPSYRDVTNHLPASAGITTQQMISYIIYFVIQLPFILIPIERLRYVFILVAGWCFKDTYTAEYRKLFLWKTMLTIPVSRHWTEWDHFPALTSNIIDVNSDDDMDLCQSRERARRI